MGQVEAYETNEKSTRDDNERFLLQPNRTKQCKGWLCPKEKNPRRVYGSGSSFDIEFAL